MHRYLIVFEKAENNYSAYLPDLPGCVATGKTRKETEISIIKAVKFHIKGLRADNMPVPEGTATAEIVLID